MSWFSNLLTNKTPSVEKTADGYFYSIDTKDTFRNYEYLKAFTEIPELNAVINKNASLFSNMRLVFVDKNGKEVETQNNNILEKPNYFQSQNELIRQTKLFHDIFGNEYLYFLQPVGMRTIKGIFSIPPNLMKIERDSKIPYFLIADDESINYKVKSGDKDILLDRNNIIHLNDNNVDIQDPTKCNFLFGTSKIKALTAPLNNIREAYESRGVILQTRGAIGILSNDQKDVAGISPLDDKEREQLKEDYRKYGTKAGQSQLIVTNMALNWQSMTINNPRNLGLFDETLADFNKILDAFGHPPDLYVQDSGSTFENQEQAEKNVYVNTIIPAANEWTSAVSEKVTAGRPYYLVAKYDHLPVFQEDIKEKADMISVRTNALSVAFQDGAITIQQYTEELKDLYGWK